MTDFSADMPHDERIEIHGTQLRLATDELEYMADLVENDSAFYVFAAEE